MFRHSCIYVRTAAGIKTPLDLKGKRAGTTQYKLHRRRLHEGDAAARVRRGPRGRPLVQWRAGHAHLTAATVGPSESAREDQAGFPRRGPDAGEHAGCWGAGCFVLPRDPLQFSEGFARLFPNYKEVEQDYYRRTRIFPVMHTVVVRDDVYKEHPWVAPSIYRAFCEARDLAVNRLYDTDALRLSLPWLIDHIEEAWRVFGKDFWAYGLEPNRPTLEAIGRYVYEQGLAPRPVNLDELFAPNVVS